MARSTAEIAAVLPEYEVERELGRGAMGVVYLGRHRRLEREVAIKELPRAFGADPSMRHRFGVEARVLASLNHPHVVPVFDYVESDGMCLLVMEALPGGTVWERFTKSGLTMPQAVAVALAACSALEHAHRQGVLHRDIKPENLMFAADGTVKVTDFGIAKVLNGSRTMATVDGNVLGTPAYMAPEQAEGRELDARVDVYAVGMMLFEMLSGRLAFDEGTTVMSLLLARVNGDPIPLSSVAPDVPVELADAVMGALARRPDDRHRSAEALGCAVGSAAATVWGEEWLTTAGLAVQGSDTIARAARTTLDTASARPATAGGRATVVPGAAPVAPSAPAAGTEIVSPVEPGADSGSPRRAAGTEIVGAAAGGTEVVGSPPVGGGGSGPGGAATDGSNPGPAPELEVESGGAESVPTPSPPAPTAAPATIVRPRTTRHEVGYDAAAIDSILENDLVEIEEVLRPPGAPVASTILGLVLLVVGLVVAAVGLGEPELDQVFPEGTVRIAGVDVATTNEIEVDLDEPIEVTGIIGERVELSLSLLGVPLGATDSAPVENGTALVDAGIVPRVASGAVTGTLVVFDTAGNERASHDVALSATNAWFTSAMGVLGVLVTLFALAAVESNLRPMRRGRLRVGSLFGLAVSGAVLGAGVALLTTALLSTPRTVPGVVVPAALCAAGAVVFGIAAARNGRRRRVKRRLEARSGR